MRALAFCKVPFPEVAMVVCCYGACCYMEAIALPAVSVPPSFGIVARGMVATVCGLWNHMPGTLQDCTCVVVWCQRRCYQKAMAKISCTQESANRAQGA